VGKSKKKERERETEQFEIKRGGEEDKRKFKLNSQIKKKGQK
jgi:hypothetical protein